MQAGYTGVVQISASAALALAIGIAIQNFPEGAIISMPLHSKGVSKMKSCCYGILTGIVEPIAGLITLLLARFIIPVLPYLLSFAAGAMIYVVVEELVSEMVSEENETHSNLGTIMFMIGFSLMMMLDVALG
ncbi:MAG: ZIP family metal transporter [Treponema sp.]|nr:ZIP family metal transporter [Treponema sp.]